MSHLRQRLPAGLHAQPGIGHHCPAAPRAAPSGLGHYVSTGLRLQPPGNKSEARGARALKDLDQSNMSGGLPEPSWGLFGLWQWGRWNEECECQLCLLRLTWARDAGLLCAQTETFTRPGVAAGPGPCRSMGRGGMAGWFCLKWTGLQGLQGYKPAPSHCCPSTWRACSGVLGSIFLKGCWVTAGKPQSENTYLPLFVTAVT